MARVKALDPRVISLAVALATSSHPNARAQDTERLTGRVRCSDPASNLRNGAFHLSVGDVRLENGKACVKPYPTYRGCEWTVSLTRVERWGPSGRFLLVVV